MRLMASRALSRACSIVEHVGGAERGPDLLAVITRDGGEHAGALRRHPHVVAAQLGVGLDVAFPLARQRRHHLVGQRLAPLAALGSIMEGLRANGGLLSGRLLHRLTPNNDS